MNKKDNNMTIKRKTCIRKLMLWALTSVQSVTRDPVVRVLQVSLGLCLRLQLRLSTHSVGIFEKFVSEREFKTAKMAVSKKEKEWRKKKKNTYLNREITLQDTHIIIDFINNGTQVVHISITTVMEINCRSRMQHSKLLPFWDC